MRSWQPAARVAGLFLFASSSFLFLPASLCLSDTSTCLSFSPHPLPPCLLQHVWHVGICNLPKFGRRFDPIFHLPNVVCAYLAVGTQGMREIGHVSCVLLPLVIPRHGTGMVDRGHHQIGRAVDWCPSATKWTVNKNQTRTCGQILCATMRCSRVASLPAI